jgi:hypothetical protein
MSSRVLKTGNNRITNSYENHNGWSKGVDVVKDFNGMGTTDYIIAHSTGKVIKVVNYMKGRGQLDNEGMGYGNYVMILHNGQYEGKYIVTLYAHLDVVQGYVTPGAMIDKGTVIGYMGNTGGSYGAHLHFEVRLYNEAPDINPLHDVNKFEWIDPTPYLDTDLPKDVAELDEGSFADYPEGSNKYYRVRTSFTDSKTSKGSYSKWANAFNRWKAYKNYGYHIYDNDGNQLDVEVVPPKTELTETSYPNYTSSSDFYRVRKSFNDSKSSKGSFHNYRSAYLTWKENEKDGYHLYDRDGKQLD